MVSLGRFDRRGLVSVLATLEKKWFSNSYLKIIITHFVLVSEVRDLDLLGAKDARTGDCFDNKKLKGNNILCVPTVFLQC